MTCEEHAQWWSSEVIENNRRFASYTNLTVPLNKDGLSLLVRGGVSGSVGFVEDDSLVGEAFVDLYVEYDPRTFGKTRFCTLQNQYDSATGVGIFVSASSNCLVLARRGRISRSDFLVLVMDPGPESFRERDYGKDDCLYAQV